MAKCPEQDCSESDGELGMSVSLTSPLMNCLPMAIILALTKRGVMSMPRKLPPHVERNHVKGHGRIYRFVAAKDLCTFVLPNDPTSQEFMAAYQAALLGQSTPVRDRLAGRAGHHRCAHCLHEEPNTSASVIRARRATLAALRCSARTRSSQSPGFARAHRHGILQLNADRPGAALDTLKKPGS
jgi:hypothetical protein